MILEGIPAGAFAPGMFTLANKRLVRGETNTAPGPLGWEQGKGLMNLAPQKAKQAESTKGTRNTLQVRYDRQT